MSSANRAITIQQWPTDTAAVNTRRYGGSAPPDGISANPRCYDWTPLLSPTQRAVSFAIPTHAVGAHPEQREYPRATLSLPLRLRGVDGVPEADPITLVTPGHQLDRRFLPLSKGARRWYFR